MAKRIHSVSLKGILQDENIIEELGKGEEPSEFYSLEEILDEFRGKMVAITIKEEAVVEAAAE
jgi:hypothetical protein